MRAFVSGERDVGIDDGLWYWSPEYELLCWVGEILGVFGGLWYWSHECELLYRVTEIVGVFGGLRY